MFRTKLSLIAALLLMTFVVGCGANGTATESLKPQENENAAGNKDASKAEETRVIQHAMGQTEIKRTPQRVVTLFQGAADVAVALGVKPVGIVESWVEKPVYKYLRDDLEGVPIVGLEPQPNLEEIAKLKPDLIIAAKIRHEKVYEQLSQIAPTVANETVFNFKETVELMGQAMNKEEQAKVLLSDWDERVADFKQKISGKMGGEWPVKASVVNFMADHARIYITSYPGGILDELGFVRSEYQQEEADKGTVVVKLTDKESIPNMNGEVIFLFLSNLGQDNAAQNMYEEWTKHPLWKNLDAVKAGNVFQVDEVAWNMAGGMISADMMLDQLYEHFELKK